MSISMTGSGPAHAHNTLEKFDGTNWLDWKSQCQRFFEEEELWPIVNGTENAPAPPAADARTAADMAAWEKEMEAWLTRDERALRCISRAIPRSQVGPIREAASSHEAWELLAKSYESQSSSQKLRSWRAYTDCMKDPSETIIDYVGRIKAQSIDYTVRDDETIWALLSGLPESFQPFILSMGDLSDSLTVTELIDRLVEEEKRLVEEGEETGTVKHGIMRGISKIIGFGCMAGASFSIAFHIKDWAAVNLDLGNHRASILIYILQVLSTLLFLFSFIRFYVCVLKPEKKADWERFSEHHDKKELQSTLNLVLGLASIITSALFWFTEYVIDIHLLFANAQLVTLQSCMTLLLVVICELDLANMLNAAATGIGYVTYLLSTSEKLRKCEDLERKCEDLGRNILFTPAGIVQVFGFLLGCSWLFYIIGGLYINNLKRLSSSEWKTPIFWGINSIAFEIVTQLPMTFFFIFLTLMIWSSRSIHGDCAGATCLAYSSVHACTGLFMLIPAVLYWNNFRFFFKSVRGKAPVSGAKV